MGGRVGYDNLVDGCDLLLHILGVMKRRILSREGGGGGGGAVG